MIKSGTKGTKPTNPASIHPHAKLYGWQYEWKEVVERYKEWLVGDISSLVFRKTYEVEKIVSNVIGRKITFFNFKRTANKPPIH